MAKKAAASRRRVAGNPSGRPIKATSSVLPLDAAPDAPSHLREYAAEMWRRIAPQLVERRVLTSLDLDALEIMCTAYQQARELEPYTAPDRAFVTTESGYVSPHPAISARSQALSVLQKLWIKFGMTPADRTSLDIEIAPADDGPDIHKFARSR